MIVVKFFWVLTLLGAAAGGLALAVTLLYGSGAPQHAAGAAIALGLAVIPYVGARAVAELKK